MVLRRVVPALVVTLAAWTGLSLLTGTVLQYLTHHGYTLLSSYQPSGRFWPFQWIEAGWLLALSLVLFSAVIWLVRRRAA